MKTARHKHTVHVQVLKNKKNKKKIHGQHKKHMFKQELEIFFREKIKY